MDFEISVYFILTGLELKPDLITSKLGITPSKTFCTGDVIQPHAKPRWKNNGWLLASQVNKSAELEDHINSIFSQLQPVWPQLKYLCQIYESSLDCVIYAYNYVPSICLDKFIIQSAAELNAKIEFDIIYSEK